MPHLTSQTPEPTPESESEEMVTMKNPLSRFFVEPPLKLILPPTRTLPVISASDSSGGEPSPTANAVASTSKEAPSKPKDSGGKPSPTVNAIASTFRDASSKPKGATYFVPTATLTGYNLFGKSFTDDGKKKIPREQVKAEYQKPENKQAALSHIHIHCKHPQSSSDAWLLRCGRRAPVSESYNATEPKDSTPRLAVSVPFQDGIVTGVRSRDPCRHMRRVTSRVEHLRVARRLNAQCEGGCSGVWVLWFFESRDALAAEREAQRQRIVPYSSFLCARRSGTPPRSRRRTTTQGHCLPWCRRGCGAARGELLCAQPAPLLLFARIQVGACSIWHGVTSADARWRARGNMGPVPMGPTRADIHKNAAPPPPPPRSSNGVLRRFSKSITHCSYFFSSDTPVTVSATGWPIAQKLARILRLWDYSAGEWDGLGGTDSVLATGART
ncbi:hypothetical protein GGX14DRAFT_392524 [Mycena pura]|uniref:Uncharacterized protein n=1 Tax=Mycena pura TaxID=153505 RepID=A0AAD6YJ78_9AGAR|nr:hypothetical protein GGX14DRAFT_392524 [Mycena pura]